LFIGLIESLDKMMSVNCQDNLLHMKKYKNEIKRNEFTLKNKIKMGKTIQ